MNRVKNLSGSIVRRIPNGSLLVYKNNTLLRAKGKKTVWVIKSGKRRSIPSAAIFNALGYRWKNIRTTNWKKLKKIPYGGKVALGVKRFIKVTANKSFLVKDGKNKKLATLSANKIVQIGYRRGTYLVIIPSRHKSIYRSSYIRIQPAKGGIAQITSYGSQYNRFRGEVQVRYSSRSRRLWAINQLRLEDYLKGMMEAGNNTDPYGDRLTYQKVMAIIARSYAGYYLKRGGRHQGEPFHLKNSRLGNGSDQVYGGYRAEFSNQRKAVDQTRSLFLTNSRSTILITPYSHGGWVYEKNKSTCQKHNGIWAGKHKCLRTRSSKEVWGGTISHCQREKDPYADRNWRCGTKGNHCVGLSALGAIRYANNNRSHIWILQHYYRNTRVRTVKYNPLIRVSIYGIRP